MTGRWRAVVYLPEWLRAATPLRRGRRGWTPTLGRGGNPDPVARMAGRGAGAGAGAGTFPDWSGSRTRKGGQANETLLVDLDPSHPGMVVRLRAAGAVVPRVRPRPAAPSRTPSPQRVSGAGAGAARDRSRVDRLALPGHAARAGRHSRSGPVLRSLCARAGPVFQRVMHDELIDVVADIHAIAVAGRGASVWRCREGRCSQTVERWVSYVEWSSEGDPLPALAQALDWCGRHVPAERPPVLLGATSDWAISSSTSSATSPQCSIGTWRARPP